MGFIIKKCNIDRVCKVYDGDKVLFIGSFLECMAYCDDYECVCRVDGAPVYKSVLREYFDRVCNPDNWKMPINAIIPELNSAAIKMYDAAIEFFTGSKAKFTIIDDKIMVKAEGYYNSIGA